MHNLYLETRRVRTLFAVTIRVNRTTENTVALLRRMAAPIDFNYGHQLIERILWRESIVQVE